MPIIVAITLIVAFAGGAAASLSLGDDALRFVISNTTQANWGCLDSIHLGSDPAPTASGIFSGGPSPLWQLTVSACNESFPSGAVMESCTVACEQKYVAEHTIRDGKSSAILRWEGCGTPWSATAKLDINVSVQISGGMSTWSAVVEKRRGAGLCLQSFTLPDLRTLRMNTAGEQLFIPHYYGTMGGCNASDDYYMGRWTPDVCTAPGCSHGSSKEVNAMPSGSERTMAYMAWLSSRAGTPGAVGLYVGAHDPWSRLKFMPAACLPLGATSFTNAGLRAVHLPTSFNDASTAAFEIPYPVVVAAFKGGWWDAAQMYRTWALQGAHWTRKGKLSARSDIPRWLLQTPVWLRLSSVDPTANATFALVDGVRDVLGGVQNLGLHWYSWNVEKFDSKYPVYAARPGFKEAVARLQRPHNGVTARVVPYTNGRLWDPTDGLTKLGRATCNGRNGTAYHEVYHSGVQFAVMDPASPLMQDTWSEVVGAIATTYNTSGVYTDQISCSRAEVCYDEVNGTNASAWAAGSQAVLAKMAAKAGDQRVIISEAHDQTHMADLHAYLTIYGFIGNLRCRTVLAWQAVYGGWSVNVGDMRWPSQPTQKDPRSGKLMFNETESAAWRAIAAQGFVAGGFLGWFEASTGDYLNHLGLALEDVSFLRRLAATKLSHAKYLTHGRLWRPPLWRTPPTTMRLHDYSYEEHDPTQFCLTPLVLAECWKADDGTVVLVAVNHATTAQTLNVSVSLHEAGEGFAQSDALHAVVESNMKPRSVIVRSID